LNNINYYYYYIQYISSFLHIIPCHHHCLQKQYIHRRKEDGKNEKNKKASINKPTTIRKWRKQYKQGKDAKKKQTIEDFGLPCPQ